VSRESIHLWHHTTAERELSEGKILRNTQLLITPHQLDDKIVLVPEKIMGLPRLHGSS
jgi:hypothetical protein